MTFHLAETVDDVLAPALAGASTPSSADRPTD